MHELSTALMILRALSTTPVRAADALIVVSEPLISSHEEALEGVRDEWALAIATAPASRPLPPGPHGVIIALGGAAAARAREAGAPTVVALAPGQGGEGGPRTVRVEMTPSPERLVKAMAAAGVKRLLALRAAPADPEFARRAAAAGRLAGVEITDALLPSPAALPALLRRAGGRADAVWLAPDPSLVTPSTFETARAFCRARAIPFFAPAAGLVAGEVRGELTTSFDACGREAARTARRLLEGRAVPKVVFPP